LTPVLASSSAADSSGFSHRRPGVLASVTVAALLIDRQAVRRGRIVPLIARTVEYRNVYRRNYGNSEPTIR